MQHARSVLSALVVFAPGVTPLTGCADAAESFDMARAPLAPALEPGSLDPTFAGDGVAIVDTGALDLGKAVVVQRSRKGDRVLVAGKTTGDPSTDFLLVRLDPAGVPDPDFGQDGNGRVITDFDGAMDEGKGLAILPDGDIVLAGITTRDGNGSFGVVRYSKNGKFDTRFGVDGFAIADFDKGNDEGKAVAVQRCGPDESNTCIVMAGKAEAPGGLGDVALARFTSKGELDPNFGVGSAVGDGRVTTDLDGGNDEANAIEVLADGRIVVGGQSGPHGAASFLVLQYDPDGTLDEQFGESGGYTLLPFEDATNSLAFSLAIDDEDRILLAGVTFGDDGDSDMVVVRFTSKGLPDTGFGDGGIRVIDGLLQDQATAVEVDADGRIIIAGKSTYIGAAKNADVDSWFSVVRLLDNGDADDDFGQVDGRALHTPLIKVPSTDADDGAYAMTIQRDGKIVVVGEHFNGNNDDLVVMRLVP